MASPPPPRTAAASNPAASIAILEIANLLSVPMALTAVIRLGVPEAIWRSGENTPLSASEILPSSTDPSLLQRLLRLLSSYNIFQEHISDCGTRRYSLTSLGQTLVGEASYADYVLQHHQDALVRAWPKLHEAVLDPTGPNPFRRANGGMPAYEYYGMDPQANGLMLRAMKGVSEPFMERLLKGYQCGFDGVERLVDVGGSSGACLEMIMKQVPSVRSGVNFDLPEVIAAAPEIPGESFAGDQSIYCWAVIIITLNFKSCIGFPLLYEFNL
jgi:O-methyltransferase domain/Dimerisation domain